MARRSDRKAADHPLETPLDVRPLAGHIGAEIHCIDLTGTLDDTAVHAVRAALLRWKVVFFRDQQLTLDAHIAFGRRFGAVTPAHPTLTPAFPDHPEILLLDYGAQSAYGADAFRMEHRWHSDVSYAVNPPMASILHGVRIPPYGGDTQWCNLVVAYETLSAPLRDLVDRLHAVHQNQLPIDRGEMPSGLQQQFASRDIRTVHPVVRVHPETGERLLWVNPNFTSHIVELSRRESRHLLAMLYEHQANPEFSCRFRWEPDSVAFWDNRATIHLVPTDTPPGEARVLHRITLQGDVPIGVDGAPSKSLAQARRSDPLAPRCVDLRAVVTPTRHSRTRRRQPMGTYCITGAASGMGEATVRRLRDEGHLVIGVDRHDADVVADLATPDGRAAMVTAVAELCGGALHGVATFAGLGGLPGRSGALVSAINVFGTMATLDGLRPYLAAAGQGSAVVISSASMTCQPGLPPTLVDAFTAGDEAAALQAAEQAGSLVAYAAGKLALTRWARRQAVAPAWIGAGVRLNVVVPGLMDTPLTDEQLADPELGPMLGQFPIPAGRTGRPEELAALVSFLLGPESTFCCGSVLWADGGTEALLHAEDTPAAWLPAS